MHLVSTVSIRPAIQWPRISSSLILTGLLLLVPAVSPAAPPGLATAPTYWVNDPGDAMDAAPGDGFCWTGAAPLAATGRLPCTLRAAITESNADGIASTTAFEICPMDFATNPDGSYTIAPGAMPLPGMTDPAAGGFSYINGYTQGYPQATAGWDDPAVAALATPALTCNGPGGLPPRPAAVNAAPFGMALTTVLSIIVDGMICAPVPAVGAITPVPGGYVPSGTIPMWAAATGGCSGFTVLDNHNVIAGLNLRNWENAGILMFPDPLSGIPPYQNVVWGNYIGTDVDGVIPMSNRFGVEIVGGSTGNYIGETAAIPFMAALGAPDPAWVEEPTAAERNLLSGNMNHPVPDVFHTYGSKCDMGPALPGVLFHDDGAGVFLGVDTCLRVSDSKFDDVMLGGAPDNQIRNNYIGTDFTGLSPLPNSNGVWLNFDAGSGPGFRMPMGGMMYPGNHIGGCVDFPFSVGASPLCLPQFDSHQDPNLISGNYRFKNEPTRPDHDGGHGIWINGAPDPYFALSGSSAILNEIGGNFIGSDATGLVKLPNSGDGIFVFSSFTSPTPVGFNEIGATSEMVPGFSSGFFTPPVFDPLPPMAFRYGNLISGNGDNTDTHPIYGDFDNGVEFAGPMTNNNRVGYGNIIGLDAVGALGLGNGRNGVKIWRQASDNLVHNNSASGLSTAFVVDDVPSSFGAISRNGDFMAIADIHGVLIENAGTTGNHVFRNCIGGDGVDCSEDFLGNGGAGVLIRSSAALNLVGQSITGGADQGNSIHHNGEDGVRIESGASDGNAIRYNSIWRNGDPGGVPMVGNLGIDLNDDGDTPNDPGDPDVGPNEEMNYPSPTSVVSSGPVVVGFTSCAGCTVDIYAQLFVDSDSPVNRGEGQTWLSAAVATGGADSINIDSAISAAFGPMPATLCVTFTATDTADNTSEFSECLAVDQTDVPSLSAWGIAIMALLLIVAGSWVPRRLQSAKD